MRPTGGGTEVPIADWMHLAAWSVLAVCFGFIARRAPFSRLMILAPVAIVACATLFALVVRRFGYTIRVDGL
jgi:hypothetical protein